MKQVIYIAEPEAINYTLVQEELEAAGYEVFLGRPDFSGSIPDHCKAVMIRSQTKITSGIKDIFPELTSVIRVGTGLDSIDTEYCRANGISIFSAPGANAEAVSEYVVMMMLVALRRLYMLSTEDIASWNRYKFRGRSLKNQTIGIVGYGAIGRLVYSQLRSLGCSSFYIYDPYLDADDAPEAARVTSLKEVLRSADVVTLHVPLTDETKYLIGGEALSYMKQGAILINGSRGGIVEEDAAVESASSGRIIYVADTVENEPQVSQRLLGSDNVIVTPHIASLTDAAETAALRLAVDNFLRRAPTLSAG